MLASITRVLELPKVHRRYLEQVVVSEVLETIPFSQEEVDLVWQVRRNGTGQEALTFAVPKETLDHHVRVLRNAGIKPKATYSKATALAHAAGVHDGVLAHIGPSEASFVLVVHGVPLIVHRMEFPRDDLSPQEWAEAVSRAVEQVASCHQSLEPKDGGQQLPVVLIGPPVGGDPFVGALKELLQRDLLPFAPPGLCF